MLVVPENGWLSLITQGDHAHLASDIVSLWRTDGLPESPRRRSVLLAVREHDNGWREADAAPRVDPETGRPYGFRELPRPARTEVWVRGTGRSTGDPWADLLVTRHALEIHADRRGKPEWCELFERLDERWAELAEAAGVDPEGEDPRVTEDYRFVALGDAVSLVACMRPAEPWRTAGVEVAWRDGAVRLDPFPLAGATTFRVRARRVPDRPYRGDADLIGELAAARWEELAVRIDRPLEE